MSYIRYSADAWRSLKSHISYTQEEVWCLALNSECRPLGQTMIFRGTIDSCPFCPRDIFRYLVRLNATGFILAHSHPSKNPSPSAPDVEATSRLALLSSLMEIPLLDHLILTEQGYFSFDESGLLQKNQIFEKSFRGI